MTLGALVPLVGIRGALARGGPTRLVNGTTRSAFERGVSGAPCSSRAARAAALEIRAERAD